MKIDQEVSRLMNLLAENPSAVIFDPKGQKPEISEISTSANSQGGIYLGCSTQSCSPTFINFKQQDHNPNLLIIGKAGKGRGFSVKTF